MATAAGSGKALLSGGGQSMGGGTQIIGGKTYNMYSPAWYAAMDAAKVQQAGVAGQAAGTQAGAAVTTLRQQVPDLFGAGSTSTSSSGSGAAGAPSVPRVSMDGGGGAPAPMAPAPSAPMGLPAGYGSGPTMRIADTSAADAARFGRAKDQIGETTRAALTGLRSALAGRGQLGGGGEFRGTSSIFTKGMGDLNEVTRDNAIQGAEADQARAALEFQGGLTTRGQDLNAQQAAAALAARLKEVAYQGDITQRGQDLAAARDQYGFAQQEKQQQQLILDRILSSLNPLY